MYWKTCQLTNKIWRISPGLWCKSTKLVPILILQNNQRWSLIFDTFHHGAKTQTCEKKKSELFSCIPQTNVRIYLNLGYFAILNCESQNTQGRHFLDRKFLYLFKIPLKFVLEDQKVSAGSDNGLAPGKRLHVQGVKLSFQTFKPTLKFSSLSLKF